MSRRSTRNRNTITLDRNELQRLISAEVARRYTPPAGANVTPITQDVINQMYASLAPQSKTQGMFTPGAPIRPVEGITPDQGPRQWQYPIGYNIGQLPRSTEMTSFQTLRNLAMLYDGIGMCEQVWFDLCSKPELVIRPRARLTKDENGDPIPPAKLEAQYGDRIAKWEDFFAKPDKRRSLKVWMRMALKERLEIDALSTFKHKDKVGRLYALEILDGSTIKPLLDERGMAPASPYPAYQQFVYGVPGMLILDSDLIYRREVERTDSPYGLSRVEKIILRVNQALRKQNKDLATFTDGNIPAGTLEPPDDGTTDWTPEQLLTYQVMWDGMLSGNDAMKSRIKVIPPGAKFTKTDPDDIMVLFDEFLLRIACGDFGIPVSELSFTETVNKSSGETQEAVLYRRTMAPMMDDFGEMFTDVMHEEDGNDDLEADWKAFEEPEDLKTKAEAWDILVKNGTQSTSQAAHAMGLKPMFETEPFVIVQGQGLTFISDAADPAMRKATNDAKMAGLQMAKDNPGGPPQNEQGTQQPSQGAKGAVGGKPAAGGGTAQGTPGSGGKPPQDGGGDGPGGPSRSLDASLPGQPSDDTTEGAIDAQATQGQDAADTRHSPQELRPLQAHAHRQDHERTLEGSADIKAEYRRWRDCAIKDTTAGKPVRAFKSDIIPAEQHRYLSEMMALCRTPEGVRAVFPVFRADKEDIPSFGAWQYTDPDIQKKLGQMRARGTTHTVWHSHPGCEHCLPNDGVKRRLGEPFPNGCLTPQAHPHCACTINELKEVEG